MQAHNQDLVSGRNGLEPKRNFLCLKNVLIGQRAEQADTTNAYHRQGSGATSRREIFVNFQKKKAI